MNNNKRDQAALLARCKGVFSPTSWLNHGSAEDPLPYVSKPQERGSYRGKQFGIAATMTGKTPDSYFDPQYKYLAEGLAFVDRWPYAEQQPTKLKGFGTGDYSKRDEFALDIRTQQYRQQLKHEARTQREAHEKLQAAKGSTVAVEQQQQQVAEGKKKAVPLLFDLVYNTESPFNTKTRRDTLNPTALTAAREFGPLKSSALLAHPPPVAAAKPPQFVHRPAIKEEFYRRSNVFFPSGCAAEPGKL